METSQHTNPNQVVRVTQIITVSMILGVLIFLGVVLVMTQNQQPSKPNLTYIALGFASAAIIGHFIFRLPVEPGRLNHLAQDGQFDRDSDEVFKELAPKYQAEHIIKMAILEAPAFFAGIAYMQERIWWNLATMGVLVFLMLVRFPTHSRIDAWIERKTLALQFGNRDF